MAEITRSTFHVLGVPEILQADLSASTLGQAGPRSLAPVKEEDAGGRISSLDLGSSGEQTAGVILDLLAQRGGTVPNAGHVWKRSTDATDEYRGLDERVTLTGFEPINWTTPVAERTPCPVVLPNGTHLHVFARRTLVTLEWKIVVQPYAPETDSYGTVATLRDELDSGQDPWPWLLPLDDGRVLCFYWVHDATENLANIDVDVSSDSGVTWTRYATSILQQELVSTATATLKRITVEQQGGQFVLHFHITDTAAGELIWQWASADYAVTFDYIGQRDDCAYPVLRRVNGVIWLLYLTWTGAGSADVYVVPVVPRTLFDPTAAVDLSAGSAINIGNAALSGGVYILTNGDLAAAVEERFIWVYGLHVSGTTKFGVAVRLDTTNPIQDARNEYARWWYDGKATSTEYPTAFQAVFYRRQCWIYGQIESGTATYEDMRMRWDLGGWSSVCMPMASTTTQDNNRATFYQHWLPFRLPSGIGATFTGAGTQDITTTPGWLRYVTAANTAYDTWTRTVAADEGMLWFFRLRVVSGGSITSPVIGARMEVATALARYQAGFHATSTQVRIQDVHGAAALGTVTIDTTGGIDVLIAVKAAVVSAWVRLSGDGWDRLWTPIVEAGVLTDGGAGGGDTVDIGHIISGTATSEWQIACGVDGAQLDVGSVIADGPTNPTDLRPGAFLTSPAWVGEGVSIGASGGPAIAGQEWTVYPDARYAQRFAVVRGEPEQLEYIRGGMRPGPSAGWRALDSADVTFPALARWTFTDAANRRMPDIVAVHFVGLNTASVSVRKHVAGGASVALGVHDQTVGSTGLAYTRSGAILSCDTSTSSTTEPWLDPDQLVGGYVVKSGVSYPILGNGAGRWSNDGDAQAPWIRIGGDFSGMAASGTIDVIPPESTFVYYNTTGESWAGVELYYSSSPTTYEDYVKADVVAVCEGVALDLGPGWGDVRDEEPVAGNRRSSWGTDYPSKVKSYRRIWKLPFTWRASDQWLRGSRAVLGDRLYWRATSTANSPIVATSLDTARKLGGIWRQCHGGALPLLWLPRVVRGTPNTASYTLAEVGRLGLLNNTPTFTRVGGRDRGGVRIVDEEGTDWVLEELR